MAERGPVSVAALTAAAIDTPPTLAPRRSQGEGAVEGWRPVSRQAAGRQVRPAVSASRQPAPAQAEGDRLSRAAELFTLWIRLLEAAASDQALTPHADALVAVAGPEAGLRLAQRYAGQSDVEAPVLPQVAAALYGALGEPFEAPEPEPEPAAIPPQPEEPEVAEAAPEPQPEPASLPEPEPEPVVVADLTPPAPESPLDSPAAVAMRAELDALRAAFARTPDGS